MYRFMVCERILIYENSVAGAFDDHDGDGIRTSEACTAYDELLSSPLPPVVFHFVPVHP